MSICFGYFFKNHDIAQFEAVAFMENRQMLSGKWGTSAFALAPKKASKAGFSPVPEIHFRGETIKSPRCLIFTHLGHSSKVETEGLEPAIKNRIYRIYAIFVRIFLSVCRFVCTSCTPLPYHEKLVKSRWSFCMAEKCFNTPQSTHYC